MNEPKRRGEETIINSGVPGTVKWFNYDKGYGFINPGDGGKDIFVHISAAERSGIRLEEGVKVNFDIVERGGKISAANLNLSE